MRIQGKINADPDSDLGANFNADPGLDSESTALNRVKKNLFFLSF